MAEREPGAAAWRDEAAARLAEVTGAAVRPYATYDFGRERDERSLSVVLAEEQARELLDPLRERLPGGTVAFLGTSRWLGEERHDGIELVIGPGDSQFDIPRLARTDGANYDLDTAAIVAKLAEYDAAHGIEIVHAESDTLEFALVRLPGDLDAFAADIYAFCPDTVDQGLGSVEALVEMLEEHAYVYLWWD